MVIDRLREDDLLGAKNVIALHATESLAELERRESVASTKLSVASLSIFSFAGFSFNHPNALLLNRVYHSIWADCLGLPSGEFRPIEFEPFGDDVHLPIPRFVPDALLAGGFELSGASPRVFLTLDDYWPLMVKFFQFYDSYAWIPADNHRHPAYVRAVNFISDLM